MNRKGLYIAMVAAGMMMTAHVDAKIWRVNNNPGKSGTFGSVVVFGDLTSALRSADVQAGDTLHIEGSVTEYGKNGQTASNCDTIRKKLVVIGPGYFLGDNAETQHNKESAKVRTLYIVPAAAGTVIAGLEQAAPTSTDYYNTASNRYALNPIYSTVNTWTAARLHNSAWGAAPACYKLRIEADNVTVSHCKLFYVDLYNASRALTNITVTKCVFNPGVITANAGVESVKNLIISNNYFRNDFGPGYENNYMITNSFTYPVIDLRGFLNTRTASTAADGFEGVSDANWQRFWWSEPTIVKYPFPVLEPTIQNNTFYLAFSVIAKGARLYNNLFFPRAGAAYPQYFGLPQDPARPHVTQNNVIYNGQNWPGTPTAGAGYSTNYGGMLPNTNGNQYSNVAETSWFTSSTTLPALDKSFILSSGSPARSSDNVDTKQRGMFGGLSPYVLSGLYTIPAVWEITIPSYPSGEVPSTGFEVRVKVKSH